MASNGDRKDSRSWIVHILSKEWPLPAKEIYNRIHRANGSEITYQGIHKSIRQLESEGVLHKVQSRYSLSPDWISSLRKFGLELEDALKGRRSLHLGEISQNSSVQLVFDSFIDFFYWAIEEALEQKAKSEGPFSSYALTYHPWPALSISKAQYSSLKSLFSGGEHFIACKGNGRLDKSLMSVWKAAGAKIALGAESPKSSDTFAFGDFVLQVFPSHKAKKGLRDIFSGQDHLNGRALVEYCRLYFESQDPVTVLVSRNAELSSQMREGVMSEFSRKG
jgi:hypothetical protein